MENTLVRNLKIILVSIFIITLIGAIIYLIFSFTIIWQAIAATIIAAFLSLLVILLIILTVYLWIKMLLLRKELNEYKLEVNGLKAELKKCKNESQKKSDE